MTTTCDACGKPLTVLDDNSLYCMFCGMTYEPIVERNNFDELPPCESREWELMSKEEQNEWLRKECEG